MRIKFVNSGKIKHFTRNNFFYILLQGRVFTLVLISQFVLNTANIKPQRCIFPVDVILARRNYIL